MRSSSRTARPFGRAALVVVLMAGCDPEPAPTPAPSATAPGTVPSGIAPGLPPPGPGPEASATPSAAVLTPPPEPQCAEEMVKVRPKSGPAYCVDRFEAVTYDLKTDAVLSPYYPPDPGKARYLADMWKDKTGTGSDLEKATRLPELPAWQRQKGLEPVARSKKGEVPQGYASGKDAEVACKNAGKRLCTLDEWKTACRGEEDRQFPYGDTYIEGRCNIFREAHPGVLLWEDPTINHTDPRFNLVRSSKGPLLRRTGGTPGCASKWGDDAIYDMVGNLDEWIDDEEGTFVGGFYARGKRDGCDAKVESHVLSYADYSTGIRCCRSLP